MDVKQAVEQAKRLFMNVFGSEISEPPSLEEVWFDDRGDKKQWCVTLGVRRASSPFAGLNLPEYKTVRVRDVDGELVAIRNREIALG